MRKLAQPAPSENLRKYLSGNPLVQRAVAAFLKNLSELTQDIPGRSILDVGCGEGIVSHYLSSRQIRGQEKFCVGIDLSLAALHLAGQIHPRGCYVCGSVAELGIKSKSFDLVLCLEVLEHVAHPEALLWELRRVAAASCIISVPHEPYFRIGNFLRARHLATWGNHPEHIQHWNRRTLQKLLAPYFRRVQVRHSFPWLLARCETD